VAAGGPVLLESMQVGELGSMGMLADPGGTVIKIVFV
jgi:predicted enzyme related to lactoylglutathione lyase